MDCARKRGRRVDKTQATADEAGAWAGNSNYPPSVRIGQVEGIGRGHSGDS